MRKYLVLSLLTAAAACAPSSVGSPSSREAPDSFTVAMETSTGPVTMIFRRDWSPNGVDRLYELIRAKYYDGARVYRVIPNFVAQWGLAANPKLTAKYKPRMIPDDFVKHSNLRGTISFARGGPNSRTAQLFINLKDNAPLDRDSGFGFPPVGEVTAGMEHVEAFTSEYYKKNPEPSQDSIVRQGNPYLTRTFPNLAFIVTVRVTKEWK